MATSVQHHVKRLVVLLLFAPLPGSSASVTVEGFSHIRSLEGIHEYRLDANGLTALLVPDSSAPVVTFNITYRVGSRNETTGTTGATHLLEHLMFKGSDRYNRAAGTSPSEYLERVGARYNATTSFDRTSYYATVGRESLEDYVAIEADRMRNLWLREEDRQVEMTVVRNEYERGKNDPDSVLQEEVVATAYTALPYRHPVIGWKSDIENVSIEKLREFYDMFYWPNNATVIVVGDIDVAATLELIGEHYGAYPASPRPIPGIYTDEPTQSGARRVTVKRPGAQGTVMIAHKTIDGRHTDQTALAVLDAILVRGKNARLYRTLVDEGLAINVRAYSMEVRDLSLHMLSAKLALDATHRQVEQQLLAEVERVKTEGVTDVEVERVKQRFLAGEAYKRDGTAGVASSLAAWVGVGDWTMYVTFPEAVARVTADDVQRVARTYLHQDQSTTGWFVPTSGK